VLAFSLMVTGCAMPVVEGPVGRGDGWTLLFADEFDGDAVDWTGWADSSSAEADDGHGNLDNQQLEWNQAANCAVSDGLLTVTARRELVVAPSGQIYGWTSCLLSSHPSFTFQHAFIETRARFPAEPGFWPGFWTWQAPGVDQWNETDAYEYYSDNRSLLYQTAHAGTSDGCDVAIDFDPSADFHVYGADIAEDGTTYYVDGQMTCRVEVTQRAETAIVDDLFVYAAIPPVVDHAEKQVDYIRAWQR